IDVLAIGLGVVGLRKADDELAVLGAGLDHRIRRLGRARYAQANARQKRGFQCAAQTSVCGSHAQSPPRLAVLPDLRCSSWVALSECCRRPPIVPTPRGGERGIEALSPVR